MGFHKDFLWGASASSYQIEGAAFDDGKGPSIWDDFCREEGKIFDGHTGDVACDHYHRFKQDVKLMAEMGLKAYRFSISWPRILPDGVGRVNEKGLQFYSDLVDELLKYGITPFATLFHWDYPSALHQRGGWLNPDSSLWFAEYTKVVVQRLGDRVKYFSTLNEPQMIIGNSFVKTNNAPGIKMSDQAVVRMIHNLLLSHGRAVDVIRQLYGDIKVGIAPCSGPLMPTGDSPEDLEAARQSYFKAGNTIDELAWGASWYSDPVVLGTYPQDGLALFGKYLPQGWQDDMQQICRPLDFYGQNIYEGIPCKTGKDGKAELLPYPPGCPRTAIGWPVTPGALYWAAKLLTERYKLPFIITENGLSCHDAVSLDGKVHDPNRIDFIQRYLREYRRAAQEGIPIEGYFYWSLMDNFEWSSGYKERFGLIYVNYETQERLLKDSAHWYRDVIASNGECL